MSEILIDTRPIECEGVGGCEGGLSPDPPIDAYPLLCWAPGHPVHGNKVFTEDGRASLGDIAAAHLDSTDPATIAATFGTTAAHVRQAVDYAREMGRH